MARVQFLAEARGFSPLHSMKTGSEVHPAFCLLVNTLLLGMQSDNNQITAMPPFTVM
jgi:hypothetical protein